MSISITVTVARHVRQRKLAPALTQKAHDTADVAMREAAEMDDRGRQCLVAHVAINQPTNQASSRVYWWIFQSAVF